MTFPLYAHQKAELERYRDEPARALFWQMRSGKSKVIIENAVHLFKAKKINAVLLFAPNGVHENWIFREIPKHRPELGVPDSFVWLTKFKDDEDYKRVFYDNLHEWDELPWFAFASATMTRPDVRAMIKAILEYRTCLVVFDESQDYRTPSSKRTKMARAVAKRCPYRRILTGTPVDNSPFHAYSQFELLRPGALGFDNFYAFQDYFGKFDDFSPYRKPVGYKNLDVLQERMAKWTSVVLRDDCADMDQVIFDKRRFSLSEKQNAIYQSLLKSFLVALEGGEFLSVGAAAPRFIKLQQVTSGFVKNDEGEIVDLGENPRLGALLDEMRVDGRRSIIWCQFREDIRRVAAALRKRGDREVVEYHGGISQVDKQLAREAMAPDTGDDGPHLVGQAQAGGSGLDFSCCSVVYWYSHTFDLITRKQATERATKMMGRNVRVVDITGGLLDHHILGTLASKRSVSETLSHDGLRDLIKNLGYQEQQATETINV